MRDFDPRAWNLLKPASALALAACGPGGLDGDGDGNDDSDGTGDATTVYSDSYDSYDDWYSDTYYDDNWDGYYNPCNYCLPDELCDGYMCYEPGCEDSLDCDDGLACVEGSCQPIPESLTCGTWPTLAIQIPPVAEVLDLSFVDVDNDDAHELVMLTATGVSVLDDDLMLSESLLAEPGQFTRVIGLRVDGDEFLDLALTDPAQGGLRTLLGAGDGSFAAELDDPLAPIVDPLADDLNLDGEDEIVGLFLGLPAAVWTVGEGAMQLSLVPSEAHQHLRHGDKDGNGQLDLLLAGLLDDPLLSSATWLLQADGNWLTDSTAMLLPLEQPAHWGAFDLDGDGLDDAFAAAANLGVVVMESWSGDIPAVASVPEPELAWILGAEFDGTNGEEVLMGTTTPRLVQRLNADPIGCSYPLEGFPSGGERAVAGDFTGDGIDEVAVLVGGVVELRVSDF